MLRESLGVGRLRLEGRTLLEVFDQACDRHPALRQHLFDEDGTFRVHILCFVDGVSTRERGGLKMKLKDGTEIVIAQAISGG